MPAIKPVTFEPDGLLAVIEELDRAKVQLEAVHEQMTQRSIKSLDITRATEALKGMKAIASFARAAQDSITDHRLGNGQ